MHFAENAVNSPLFIRSYHEHVLITQAEEYRSSIVLFNDQAFHDLLPACFNDLDASHFQHLTALAPELILLGTGKVQHFPLPLLLQPIFKAKIGYEIMSTAAACRTFNLLLAEGRSVLAALLL